MHSEKISNLLRMNHSRSRFDPYEDCDRSDLIREIEIAEEKNGYLELDNEDLKTAIRVLVDLYAGERSFRGDSYE